MTFGESVVNMKSAELEHMNANFLRAMRQYEELRTPQYPAAGQPRDSDPFTFSCITDQPQNMASPLLRMHTHSNTRTIPSKLLRLNTLRSGSSPNTRSSKINTPSTRLNSSTPPGSLSSHHNPLPNPSPVHQPASKATPSASTIIISSSRLLKQIYIGFLPVLLAILPRILHEKLLNQARQALARVRIHRRSMRQLGRRTIGSRRSKPVRFISHNSMSREQLPGTGRRHTLRTRVRDSDSRAMERLVLVR